MNAHLFISILMILMTFSTPVSAKKTNLKFAHLSLEEGLSQSTVYAIHQDSQGFMWFGTQDGLNKYDGYQFTVYRHEPLDINSLSHNEVFVIYEDSTGVLWIGTGNGLNQFDRQQNKFIRYMHDPENPNSLSSNTVWSIYEDNTGKLWIGTNGGGLNQFNRQHNTFVHYQHDPENPHSLSHNSVWPIYQDKTGQLWIGTDGGGLNKFDPQQNQFTHYLPDAQNPDHLSNFITSIYEDSTGTLWVGTSGSLLKFDRQRETFVSYVYDPKNPYSLSENAVWAIGEDRTGALWIATDGGGLNQFDHQTGQFAHYQHNPQNPNSLNNNAVLSLYRDNAGTMWAGTAGGGVNYFNREQQKFEHYFHEPQNANSISDNYVLSIYEDRTGLLWVGTRGSGLDMFDSERQTVTHYQYDPQKPDSLSHNEIQSIYEDRSGTLWVGTFGGGLNQFNRAQNQFVSYVNEPDNPDSLSDNYVMSIYEDSTGALWIGTREGINKFDRQHNQFVHYVHDPQNPQSLSHNTISTIYEDSRNTLWIGTEGGGLNKFDRQQGTFAHYQHDAQNPFSLSHDDISSIYEDGTGTLWIGSFGGGLNKFDRVTERFYAYRETDGLANNVVYGILADEQGDLWISSNKGLSKFDPKTETFRNYDILDGLQSNEFNPAYHKSQHGELFFGGINGFNAFYPAQVKDNPYIPPIVITDFKIFNQFVPLGGDSPLQQDISTTQAITLSYEQSFFSFEFAALNFVQPDKNQYAYILEGIDHDWNFVGTRRNAYYTYVPHGTYMFRAKGTNNDHVWNQTGTAIKITILPPPWKTWWAYTLYFLMVLAIMVGYIRVQQRKLRAKQQELEREQKTAAQLREVNKLKDEFLANTSHELRTPLNGIIGIAESLVDGATGQLSQNTQTNLSMIVSSGRRLLNLVNDILDFSQLKKKEIDLQKKTVDMRTIAEVVLTLTQPLIGHKKVQLVNAIPSELPPVSADESRVQQILYNLVGNAIKFTDSGTITVSAEVIQAQGERETEEREKGTEENDLEPTPNSQFPIPNSQLAITIADTGIGIHEQKLDRIFDAFEQADGSTARAYGGTGLGLTVTQQLVRLHGGQMHVDSKMGIGSKFTFTLPMSGDQLSVNSDQLSVSNTQISRLSDRLSTQESLTMSPSSVSQEPLSEPESLTLATESPTDAQENHYTILIVDDEPVNRQVLINHLFLQNYTIVQATDGQEALKLINEGLKPDLILLDVMMPKMTGYFVTKKIREKWQANELPIVLLTAKNQVQDLVTGLELGANDYLTKPVSKEELLARIKTHIRIQQLSAENLRMSAELSVTRRLQKLILPAEQELTQVADLDIAGFMEPADEVGGDYYDVLQHDGRILFGIGDVTGHGLESSMLMLMAQMAVRTLLTYDVSDLNRFLTVINRALYENINRMNLSKDLSLCLLEYCEGVLTINGQHEEVIVVRNNGDLERIDTIDLGFPIGLEEDITDFVAQAQITLNSGDIVVLYTDGITEAENKAGKLYGLEQLCEVIQRHAHSTVENIRQTVIDDVRQHIGKNKVYDDMTLLILKKK